ncbi:MAG: hypothetical protein V2J24_16270 [Pseudomonadales bacterium]|jgi:hypothetical protein|nr:hypothetical protein [Pseudomonadales bacterium]
MKRIRSRTSLLVVLPLLCVIGGCATSRPPTIAHVHVGHAITGAPQTPGELGYFVIAEDRMLEARALVDGRLGAADSVDATQDALVELNAVVNGDSDYSLARAVDEAANHIEFAAQTDDATRNVERFAVRFRQDVDGVLQRAGLVDLYVRDALEPGSRSELAQLTAEIARLVRAVEEGEDADGSGTVGDAPGEAGMVGLRRELDAMVEREDPPYSTVDRWYLMNLVRLPGGEWIFRRMGSSAGAGY